jgi:hypothetical protein
MIDRTESYIVVPIYSLFSFLFLCTVLGYLWFSCIEKEKRVFPYLVIYDDG